MSALLKDVTREIVELHEFFTAWFNGTAPHSDLDERFISRLDPKLTFISPDGHVLSAADMRAGFEQGFGSNPNFEIEIRDVTIRYDLNDHVLATYTEWQRGAQRSQTAENARFTTVLMKKGEPYTWLHIQETSLPVNGAR